MALSKSPAFTFIAWRAALSLYCVMRSRSPIGVTVSQIGNVYYTSASTTVAEEVSVKTSVVFVDTAVNGI